MLIENYGVNIDLQFIGRTATELRNPFQVAVAFQNFEVASYFFEKGAHRDTVVDHPEGPDHDCSLLGWLIDITWSESKHRIRYLFDEYPEETIPHFIVKPNVGRSVLQHAASRAPPNKLNEQEMQEMIQYLIQKYPGSRHLEYQRIDNTKQIRTSTRHSGRINATVDGKDVTMVNSFHFHDPNKIYTSTKEKEYNGTALHHAVRAVNYPAVQVLLNAGADASAMLGMPTADSIFSTRKPASTYAVKENLVASTVLDFAVLVEDRIAQGIFPVSMPDSNPSTMAYFKQRAADITDLLKKKGAANSGSFVGARNDERIFRERREKGTIAAFQLFKKEVKDNIPVIKQVYKESFKGLLNAGRSVERVRPQVHETALANSYLVQGRLSEAVEIYESVLASYEKELGNHHDMTLRACLDLGRCYTRQVKLKEAEELIQRALHGFETLYGENHELTLSAMNSMGAIYLRQQRSAETEEVLLKVVRGRETVLGRDNIETLKSLLGLGEAYSSLGKYEEADKAYERAIKALEKTVEPDHDTLLGAYSISAFNLSRKGMHKEAKALREQEVRGQENKYGREHFETLGAV